MKICNLITCDTRPGAADDFHEIKDYGSGNLMGCHSLDFLTHGVVAKNRYLAGYDRETILCVDIHDPIPQKIRDEIDRLKEAGEIQKVIATTHSKSAHRWNDFIYISAYRQIPSDCTHVAKWDGDCIGYKGEDVDMVGQYLRHLAEGYKYVCQQTPLAGWEHKMFWASSRFFFCERETINIDEIERCLNDGYRAKRLPGLHLPCAEHIMGALSGEGSVLYPPSDNGKGVIWSWVHYYSGIIEKLNSMSYDEVKKYVFETCGGPLGASDLIAKPL